LDCKPKSYCGTPIKKREHQGKKIETRKRLTIESEKSKTDMGGKLIKFRKKFSFRARCFIAVAFSPGWKKHRKGTGEKTFGPRGKNSKKEKEQQL